MRYLIGNLPYTCTEAQLWSAIGYLNPRDIDMVHDKLTGRFRGYAFADLDAEPTEKIVVGIRRLHFKPANLQP
jgi:RNA recognition motif-containing protein